MQRLGPPHWPAYPAGATYGALYRRDPALGMAAARLGARLIAADLAALGITVDCLPLADVPVAGADRGDRRSRLWRYPAPGRRSRGRDRRRPRRGGVLPVLKHLPGHGRAAADSHDAAAGRRRRPRDLGGHRLCGIHAARRTAAGDDGPCGIHSHRSGASGDHLVHYHRAGDSWIDWIFRSLDERRRLDGSLVGLDCASARARALAAGCDLVLHCNGKLARNARGAAHCPRAWRRRPGARRAGLGAARRARRSSISARRGSGLPQ